MQMIKCSKCGKITNNVEIKIIEKKRKLFGLTVRDKIPKYYCQRCLKNKKQKGDKL